MRQDIAALLQRDALATQATALQGHAYTVLENLKDQLDPFMKGWLPLGGGDKLDMLSDTRPQDLRE